MPKLAQLTKEQLDSLSQKLHETIKYTRQKFTNLDKRLLYYFGEDTLAGLSITYIDDIMPVPYEYNPVERILCAIKYASFRTILKETILTWHISEEALDAAKARDEELFTYVYEQQKIHFDALVSFTYRSSLNVAKFILDYQTIPLRLLTDFISTYPEAIQSDKNNENNTLLHWAITSKDIKKVQALMQAIYQVGFKNSPGFIFEIEQKNSQGKTVLDLALAQGNNELTAIILLFGNPLINTTQQDKLITAKIDIPAIHNKRETMVHEIIRKQNQNQDSLHHESEIQHKALTGTIEEVIKMQQLDTQIIKQLECQEQKIQMLQQQLQMQQQMLIQLMHLISPTQVIPNTKNSTPAMLLQQPVNPNGLFAPNCAVDEQKDAEALLRLGC